MDLEPEIVLNIAAYVPLALGLLEWRRRRLPRFTDAGAAFRLLEDSLKRAFPDLRDGFTWREGISRARDLDANLDWEKIQRDVDVYEVFRYGGGPRPSTPGKEFLRLIRTVRRGR